MRCVECEEEITNPVCPECLGRGIRQWLLEQGHERLASEADAVLASCASNHGTQCVCCGRAMIVCAYCSTAAVLPIVKRDRSLIAEFLTYFNFDLGHLGWEREARIMMEDDL